MNIGVCIFPTDRAIRPDELARELEARTFESLFVPEHTHIPTSRRSPFAGGAPLPEDLRVRLDKALRPMGMTIQGVIAGSDRLL